MNALSMTERNKIIGLLSMGWTQRQMERETGHQRQTIASIGRNAGLLPPKCTTSGEMPTDSKAAKVATDSRRSRSSCEPYRGVIEAELAKGCHGVSIYQHLVDHHGYEGAYNAVKRFVGKLRRASLRSSAVLKRSRVKKRKLIMAKEHRRGTRARENTPYVTVHFDAGDEP